jgi:uncharacterized membrane protein
MTELAGAHRTDDDRARAARRVLRPGLVIGIGLGGFVDGILLHQILQWHHMLTNTPDDTIGLDAYPATTVDGLEVNTLVDGFFHAFTWFAVVIGLVMLWRVVVRRPGAFSWPALTGAVLAGWGVFNLVEGIVDHHILRVHHVRTDVEHVWAWDVGFLALGAVLLAGGLWIHRRAIPAPRDRDVT